MNDYDEIFDNVERAVCEYYELTIDEVVEKTNKKQPSMARGLLYYALHYIYNVSIGKIAKRYNRKERGVKALVSKMKFLVENHKQYKQMINSIYI